MAILVTYLIYWMLVGGAGGLLIAAAMHKPRFRGFLVGALMGVFGWLLILVWKGNTRKCPRCGEQVQKSALVCRYCGTAFGSTAIAGSRQSDVDELLKGYRWRDHDAVEDARRVVSGTVGVGGTKTCPRCAEPVKAAAVICRFCQYEFPLGYVTYETSLPGEFAQDHLPLLESPTATAPTIADLRPPVTILVLGATSDFFYVRANTGATGWAARPDVWLAAPLGAQGLTERAELAEPTLVGRAAVASGRQSVRFMGLGPGLWAVGAVVCFIATGVARSLFGTGALTTALTVVWLCAVIIAVILGIVKLARR